MDYYGLEFLGDKLTMLIKQAPWFPFKSGNLMLHATSGSMYNSSVYRIHFSGTVAPYLEYLEEGTRPHNIIGAFIGKEAANKMHPPFGSRGRFDGKFHPGSTKHKGFIKDKAVQYCVDYIAQSYRGEVELIS